MNISQKRKNIKIVFILVLSNMQHHIRWWMCTNFILPLDFKVSLDLMVFLNSKYLDVDYLGIAKQYSLPMSEIITIDSKLNSS
jgi:hypothetical protein